MLICGMRKPHFSDAKRLACTPQTKLICKVEASMFIYVTVPQTVCSLKIKNEVILNSGCLLDPLRSFKINPDPALHQLNESLGVEPGISIIVLQMILCPAKVENCRDRSRRFYIALRAQAWIPTRGSFILCPAVFPGKCHSNRRNCICVMKASAIAFAFKF